MDKFDITKHEWNGELFGIEGVEIDGEHLKLNVNYENFPIINKNDAMAIAKHFGIIDEALEEFAHHLVAKQQELKHQKTDKLFHLNHLKYLEGELKKPQDPCSFGLATVKLEGAFSFGAVTPEENAQKYREACVKLGWIE